MSEIKYLTKEKVIILQEIGGFLNNYTSKNEIHHIGPDINTEDVKDTSLLKELGQINLRRNQIIEELCQKEK